jgi:AhpD family alkylhydroperoxidase
MKERFSYWTIAPQAYEAIMQLRLYLKTCSVDNNLLNLIYLRISQINGCAFCVDLHSSQARKAGETEQRLQCVVVWREATCFDARERAALDWAENVTLVSESRVPDSSFAAASSVFSPKEMVDLTYAIAHMNALNRLSVSFRRQPIAATS